MSDDLGVQARRVNIQLQKYYHSSGDYVKLNTLNVSFGSNLGVSFLA